jgi:2-alkyl-3-oxoalkanoate reductase
MARVLLTGATGFVGGRVAARLRQRGNEVVAAVRTPSAALEAIGVAQRELALDAIDAEALAGVDGLVHAAASVGPDYDSARAVNTVGTRSIAAAALEAGVHLVHVSTTSVYDLRRSGDVEVREDAPLAAADAEASPTGSAGAAYSVTKAEAEHEVVAARDRGLSAAILRPPAVLGAGPTSTWGTKIPRMVLEGRLPGRHPEQTYGWVHVEDLVDAVLAALDQGSAATANVVGGHTTVGRYLAEVAALLPGDVVLPATPDDVDEPWRGSYAADRLPAALGVTPSRTFDQAMEEIAVSWASGPPDERS